MDRSQATTVSSHTQLSPSRKRGRHTASSGGQVVRRELRDAHQLITHNVARIARRKKSNMRICFSASRDLSKRTPQSLRILKTDHPSYGIVMLLESLLSQAIDESLPVRGRLLIKTRKEFAPKQRKK